MKLNRIVKAACLSLVAMVCAFFAWVAVGNILFSGADHTQLSITPKKWRLSLDEQWILMNTNGQMTSTTKVSQIGPVIIKRNE